ncbi:hypothetical protein DYB31_011177 [Aphanomyces astaci]|uniref:Prolyl endopeptidase-like n=1 Tax=Aphanomyces astaci TaxID=112090 RepID=A0A397FXL5_APHAT|nr:hypothetical protein DYB31_011177 [Aphanomyces astaci]
MSVPLHIVLDKQKAAHNSHWTSVFAYDPTVKVASVISFESFFVLSGRQDGLTQRWICGKDTNNSTWHKTRLPIPEAIYSLGTAKNAEYATTKYRYTERVEATASDGTTIPMSVIYRKDKKKAEGQPQALHLYGYGSYEASFGASFLILSRRKYEAAKYLTKMTTFTDFIACAEHLVATKVTSPSHMTCEGVSAGGLLIGASGLVYGGTMSCYHWAEWGNPNELKYFTYMLQYSPFHLCVQVAKLRDLKTDNNQVLFKIDLDGGHCAHLNVNDRYHFLKEKTVNLSFLLDQLKCLEK